MKDEKTNICAHVDLFTRSSIGLVFNIQPASAATLNVAGAGSVDFSPFHSDAAKITLQDITVKADGTVGDDCDFLTIQSAIDMASPYDKIYVLAGTYNERITINKPLTLRGATYTINKNGYTVPANYAWDDRVESIINNPEPALLASNVVDIVSDDVILEGFVIQSLNALAGSSNDHLVRLDASTGNANDGLVADKTLDNIIISNNVIGPNTNLASQDGTAGRMGLYFASPTYSSDEKGITNTLITGNKIFDCKGNGNNIFVWGSAGNYGSPAHADYTGTIIQDNEIYGSHRSGIEIAGGVDGLTISNNKIYKNAGLPTDGPNNLKYGNGIVVIRMSSDKTYAKPHCAQNLLIENNKIYDNQKNGIYFGPINTHHIIAGNTINDNGWDAVRIDLTEQYHSGALPFYDQTSKIVFEENTIYNNKGFGANLIGTPTNGFILYAEENYWGAKYPDFGAIISGIVNFSPYYADAAKTTLQDITVKAGGIIGTDCSFTTIQSAINAASSGDTIKVTAGTYAENLNTTKSVHLLGPNAGINPNTGTRVPEAVITGTVTAVTIASDGVTLDGFSITNPTGNGLYALAKSELTIKNNIFYDIGTSLASGTSQAIYIKSTSLSIHDITIENNEISNVGNVKTGSNKGIFIGDSNGALEIGNVVIGGNVISSISATKGAYGILVNYGCSSTGSTTGLEIIDNIISDLEGLWAHAIGLEGNTPNAMVTGNVISDVVDHKSSSDAIGIFFEANPSAGTVTVENNQFAASVYWGVAIHPNLVGVTVDATNNWWSDSTGPNHSTTWTYESDDYGPHQGLGTHVSNNVLYLPYITRPVTIVASSGSGGSISPLGSVSVNYGSDQTFAITPRTGYSVVDVVVDGVSVGVVTSYTLQDATANHTISASFAINSYTITAFAGSGGSITPNEVVSVNYGTAQTFTITPNTGYSIADVLVDGVSQGAITSYTFSNVQTSHVISVTFTANTLTITAFAGSGGSISPSGSVSVNYGSNQVFTITPNTGYSVVDVVVDGASVGAVTSYTFQNVTATHSISASFAINTFTITASAGTNGQISPSGSLSVDYGNDQAFTITPNTGYRIDDVLVDGVSQGAITAYTFTNVQANHTISASFVTTKVTITASAGSGGSINPSGSVSVDYDSDQVFTVSANAGYRIADVLVDGVSVGAVGSYTFTNVQEAHTITASFARPQLFVSVSPASVTMDLGQSQAFTAAATGGSGTYTSYQWTLNGNAISGATSSTYVFTPTTAGSATIAVTVTDNEGAQATSGTATVTVGTSVSTPLAVTGGTASVDDTPTTGVSVTVEGSSVQDGAVINIYTANFGSAQPTDTGGLQLNVNAVAFYDVQVNSTADLGTGAMVTINFTDPSFTEEDNFLSYWNGTSWVPVASYFIPEHTISGIFPASALTGTRILVGKTVDVITYTLTVEAGNGGSISPSGNIKASQGSSVTFTITPDSGYQIADILIDGTSIDLETSFTLKDVKSNHTITVTFSQLGIPPGYIAGIVLVAVAFAILVSLFVIRSRQKKVGKLASI